MDLEQIGANSLNDINQIKAFYRELGYYFVKIEAEVEDLENNSLNVIYTVERGEKAKISKITPVRSNTRHSNNFSRFLS